MSAHSNSPLPLSADTGTDTAQTHACTWLHTDTATLAVPIHLLLLLLPGASDLPVPLYGYTKEMALEWWKTRNISSIGYRAISMLYNERQLKYYQSDMDLPW